MRIKADVKDWEGLRGQRVSVTLNDDRVIEGDCSWVEGSWFGVGAWRVWTGSVAEVRLVF